MKTEINNENKAKFFVQYWGQHVLREYNDLLVNDRVDTYSFIDNQLEISFLELNPLSSITDEDAIEVAKTLGYGYESFAHMDLHFDVTNPLILECSFYSSTTDIYEVLGIGAVDYLRSRGYAIPWMGLSVGEMVQAGWIKLKES